LSEKVGLIGLLVLNRMDSERKVSYLFNNNPQGLPKTRWWNYVQTDIKKCKIKNWKERSETELNGEVH